MSQEFENFLKALLEECRKIIKEHREAGLKKSGIGKPNCIVAAKEFVSSAEKALKSKTIPLSEILSSCKKYHSTMKTDLNDHNLLTESLNKDRLLKNRLYVKLINKIMGEETFSFLVKSELKKYHETYHTRLEDILSELFSPFKTMDDPANSPLPDEKIKKERDILHFFLYASTWNEIEFQEKLKKLERKLQFKKASSSEQSTSLGEASHPEIKEDNLGLTAPSAPCEEEQQEAPPPYSEIDPQQSRTIPHSNLTSVSPLTPLSSGRVENSSEGGPGASSPSQASNEENQNYRNLAECLKSFQEEGKTAEKRALPIAPEEICRDVADKLGKKFMSPKDSSPTEYMKEETGQLCVRQFNKGCTEKINKGDYKIKQPDTKEGKKQFRQGGLAIQLNKVKVGSVFMRSGVVTPKSAQSQKTDKSIPLKQYILKELSKYRINVNRQILIETLQESCSQVVAFVSPVSSDGKGEKVVITSERYSEAPENGDTAKDRFIKMVLEHKVDKNGEAFYVPVDETKIISGGHRNRGSFCEEFLLTESKCITVTPVSNELLEELSGNPNKNMQKIAALSHLLNEHHLVITMELKENLKRGRVQDEDEIEDSDLCTDGGIIDGSLVARGEGSTTLLSHQATTSCKITPLQLSNSDPKGDYTVIGAHMTIIRFATMNINEISHLTESKVQERIENLMKLSKDCLETATGLLPAEENTTEISDNPFSSYLFSRSDHTSPTTENTTASSRRFASR